MKRRFDVSRTELEQVAAARRRRLSVRALLGMLRRTPGLAPELARVVAHAAWQGVWVSNEFASIVDSERVRMVVADAARGVGWSDERPFLDVLFPLLTPATRALELGCGAGRISRHVAPRVAELVCTDVSRLMVAEAAENLAHHPNVRFQTTDGYTLARFNDTAFDVVFAQGVLTYLDPNPLLAVLAEVRRVLRPEGTCVFNFDTIDAPEAAQRHLEAVRHAARRRRFGGGLERAYTLPYIRSLHEAAGLQVDAPASPRDQRTIVVGQRSGL
jgi:SAM-dependent methyltransferase